MPTGVAMHDIDPPRIDEAQDRVEALYNAVGRARNLKAEYGLGTNKDVRFIIDPDEAAAVWLSHEIGVFARLCGGGGVEIEDGHTSDTGVPVALTGVGKVYMPLEGLIDVDAERERLSKELGKAEEELKKVNGKLSNENFVSRAPEEVVEENRERQRQGKERVEELEKMIENLGAA